tara:strand:+ start:629 stop:1111 length:483 start_codon:yes stop_codon:yes gene_type:complete
VTQLKGKGSWWDLAAFTERIMQMLEPMLQEMVERIVQGTLDRQSIAWSTQQVQRHREYRDQRERRKQQDQPRFISDQPVPDPTIPPGGSANDVLIKLNELVGAISLVAQQQQDSDKRSKEQFEELKILLERIANQLSYLIGGNPWEQPPKESWIEKPEDS